MKPRSRYSALLITKAQTLKLICTASVDTSLFPVIIHALDEPFEKGIKRIKFPNGAVMSNTLDYIAVVKNWIRIPLE